jgi:hypothetical protein
MSANTPAMTDARAARFVAPILFPLDLLLLVCLGGFTAMASLLLSEPARFPAQLSSLLVLLPIIYVAADLAENCLYAHMLLQPSASAVTEGMVAIARCFTAVKLVAGATALLQAALLLLAWLYFHFLVRT